MMKTQFETSQMAKSIEVVVKPGNRGHQLLVDGEPFPWLIAQQWSSEAASEDLSTVTISLFCENLTVRTLQDDD